MMKRRELLELSIKIETALNSEEILGFDIVYALNKTSRKIKTEIGEINDMMASFKKEATKLVLIHCTKDDDGKPVIANNKYQGLDTGLNNKYDEATEVAIQKEKGYFNEEVEVEIHEIDKEVIPKKGPANVLNALCYFVK